METGYRPDEIREMDAVDVMALVDAVIARYERMKPIADEVEPKKEKTSHGHPDAFVAWAKRNGMKI